MIRAIRILCLVLIAAVASGCWAAAAGAGAEAGYVLSQKDRSAGQTIDDQRITSAVKTKLLADEGLTGLDIDVDTSKGVVTLNGPVKSRNQADRAVRLARNTSGVRGVQSRLAVH